MVWTATRSSPPARGSAQHQQRLAPRAWLSGSAQGDLGRQHCFLVTAKLRQSHGRRSRNDDAGSNHRCSHNDYGGSNNHCGPNDYGGSNNHRGHNDHGGSNNHCSHNDYGGSNYHRGHNHYGGSN